MNHPCLALRVVPMGALVTGRATLAPGPAADPCAGKWAPQLQLAATPGGPAQGHARIDKQAISRARDAFLAACPSAATRQHASEPQ